MNMTSTKKHYLRSWPITFLSVPPFLLFLYVGIGVWLSEAGVSFTTELYAKCVVSLLSLFGAFVFGRIILRGRLKKPIHEILGDLLSSF